jgi:hypothetical protein
MATTYLRYLSLISYPVCFNQSSALSIPYGKRCSGLSLSFLTLCCWSLRLLHFVLISPVFMPQFLLSLSTPFRSDSVFHNDHCTCTHVVTRLTKMRYLLRRMVYLYPTLIAKSCSAGARYVETPTLSLHHTLTSRTSFPLIISRQLKELQIKRTSFRSWQCCISITSSINQHLTPLYVKLV